MASAWFADLRACLSERDTADRSWFPDPWFPPCLALLGIDIGDRANQWFTAQPVTHSVPYTKHDLLGIWGFFGILMLISRRQPQTYHIMLPYIVRVAKTPWQCINFRPFRIWSIDFGREVLGGLDNLERVVAFAAQWLHCIRYRAG